MTASLSKGTLLLTRSDLAALMSMKEYIQGIENAFRMHGEGLTYGTDMIHGDTPGELEFHIKSGGLTLKDKRYYGLKINGSCFTNMTRFGLPNIMGAINMLGLAKRVRARILQASTSEVYGDPEIHPQTEDYRGHVNPIGLRACYDEGKRCAETLFFDYHRQNSVDIRVVRIFNTYGPRMHPDDGRVVSNFIMAALTGRDVTVYGDGSQTRSFCYVEDLIEGLVRMMDAGDFIGPVNLGNPEEMTVQELAETIIDLTGSKSSIIHKPLPADDPQRRRPDITLARQRLDWQPVVKLRDGLEKTIAYFEAMLNE